MKQNNSQRAICLLAFLLIFLVSCAKQEAPSGNDVKAPTEEVITETQKSEPDQLPVRFQTPSYYTQDQQASDVLGEDTEDYAIKVGANITSTKGPQPLWDILKRLANLRGMTVSWSSDVDQNVLVDVNIGADDNFSDAIDNLLRQVDYFHEMKGNAIIVKYRETKKFNIAIPYMKGSYTTNVGGNFLAGREAATGTEGTVKVNSGDNQFDVWQNIATNMDAIMQEWRTQKTEEETITSTEATSDGKMMAAESTETKTQQATRQVSLGGSYYTIDKSVGMITVTAPRPLLEKIENYLAALKKELYRQVVIEAKIIEVTLSDNSKIGLDWSQVLKNFNINGVVEMGTGGLLGQVWPWNPPDEFKPTSGYDFDLRSPDPNDTTHYLGPYPDSFIHKVSLAALPFSVMLNALNEQGEATVLSNPKMTVLNGQPAVLSVGEDVTYISEIEGTVDDETGDTTYTVTTDSIVSGVAFGVMASIIDENSVILHLTPITTDLVGDTIEYRQVGLSGSEVGLPVVQVREMSTMVQVNNGEMLIIGGLIASVEGKQSDFAPVLGDIPLVRYLFGVEEKRMEKKELVILLTPRIM